MDEVEFLRLCGAWMLGCSMLWVRPAADGGSAPGATPTMVCEVVTSVEWDPAAAGGGGTCV